MNSQYSSGYWIWFLKEVAIILSGKIKLVLKDKGYVYIITYLWTKIQLTLYIMGT